MVPKGWNYVPMGRLVEKVTRPVSVDQTQRYQEIGIRSHGRGLFDKEPVTGADLGDKRVFWVEPNCLILNIVFAWEQAVGRTTNEDRGKIASHRFPMYKPRAGRSDIDYLTYLFKTPYGKYILGLASPGGAGRNKTLGQSEFLKTVVCVPSISEQQRIVAILKTWDRAITTVDRLFKNSVAQRDALMQSLLTGKQRLPGFSAPWMSKTVQFLGPFKKGKGLKRDDVQDHGLPCVLYGDIYTKYQYVARTVTSFIPQALSSTAQPIQTGDLLYTASGETKEDIGRCVAYLGDAEAYAGGDILIQSPNGRVADAEFLGYLLNHESAVRQKARLGQGHSVVHISAKSLASIPMRLPGRDEQRAIASLLTVSERMVQNYGLQHRQLASQKEALMQQLLTGKRRVRCAQPKEVAHA
jgi:type I restriction enzyme S subunit